MVILHIAHCARARTAAVPIAAVRPHADEMCFVVIGSCDHR